MRYLSIFIISFLLISCEKDVDQVENAKINYYLTTKSDSVIRYINLRFEKIRVYIEHGSQLRPTSLDTAVIMFDLADPKSYFLGASDIDPNQITGFDIQMGCAIIGIGNVDYFVGRPSPSNNYNHISVDFELKEGQSKDITFIMDVDRSFHVDSTGKAHYNPFIELKK